MSPDQPTEDGPRRPPPNQSDDDGSWGPPPPDEPAPGTAPSPTPRSPAGLAAARPEQPQHDHTPADTGEPTHATTHATTGDATPDTTDDADDEDDAAYGFGDGAAEEAVDEQNAPQQMDVVQWVEQIFKPMVQRKVYARGTTWCDQWTHHTEVVIRLDALRALWYELYARGEDGRLADPTGPSSFWVHHLDLHLNVLLDSETGPMAGCHPGPNGHAATPVPPFSEL